MSDQAIASIQARWVKGQISWLGVKEMVRFAIPAGHHPISRTIRERRRALRAIGKIA